jgi:Single-stranded DNA-specific exonuclease
VYKKKSILGNFWKVQFCDERSILSLSQKNNISPLLARLLLVREIDTNLINEYLNPNIHNNLPDPFLLKDMEKAVERTVNAIVKGENIGIISDYDVDGSTSAAILFKFLNFFSKKIYLKIPNRLSEGYGPNIRIMDEMKKNNT